jgi:hypothetical protein
MQDAVLVESTPKLSQGARLVDTFVAPSKTFTDVLRSANCWLPIALMVVLTIVFAFSIGKSVGYTAVTEQQIAKNEKQAAAMQQLPPEQRAARITTIAKFTQISTYASSIFVVIFCLIETLILWGSFNFILGAGTKFSQVFAVVIYAGLPRYLIWILAPILLFSGVGTDSFDLRNPVGTNIGYFVDTPAWLKTAGTFFDVLGFWSLALLVIGMAIIARKSKGQAAAVVIGWWALILLIVTGFSAAFS